MSAIDNLANQLRQRADRHPVVPLEAADWKTTPAAALEVEGYGVYMAFARVHAGTNRFYQLAILEPGLLPERVVRAVVAAFLPEGTELAGTAELRKWVQRIEG